MIIESRAYARAGLLGNPSDGYFGKTISVIVRNFGASVVLYESPELVIEPQKQDGLTYASVFELYDQILQTGYHGGIPLIKATIKKFVEYCLNNHIKLPPKNFSIRYSTNIPRQVGLAGSSAIVTAVLKGLVQFYQVTIPLEMIPTVSLSVEIDELGITAGLQDRVIQAYEGCVYMDFNKQHLDTNGYGKYERLPIDLLPNFYLAYKTDLSKVSGKVLNDIRGKYERGDKATIKTLANIAGLAEAGRTAILSRDFIELGKLINSNFDYRTEIMNISEPNMELVNTARSCGASASFSGSGGAIIGIYENDKMLERLVVKLKSINARVIKPIIAG